MARSYSDQFFTLDPANPPSVGTVLTTRQLTLTDQNRDGDIDRFNDDSVGGLDVRSSWPGDKVTIRTPDGNSITYTGTTFYLSDGSSVFTPTDGQTLKVGALVSTTYVTTQGPLLVNQLGPPCFASGTRILTASGWRRVETLAAGDLVSTADQGCVPLLAVLNRRVPVDALRQNPRHCPVVLPSAAVSGYSDGSELRVSPQHRILLRSPVVQRMFGTHEVLTPAIGLVGYMGVRQEKPCADVGYIHLLFDHHAIVRAEGMEAESLLLADRSLAMLDRQSLLEVAALISPDRLYAMRPARRIISGRRLRRLLERHSANGHPLCVPASIGRLTAA